jgi:hypothetical protein
MGAGESVNAHTGIELRLRDSITRAFRESIREKTDNGDDERDVFERGRFFNSWFKSDPDRCFFFLFKKNLRVTDIQFSELLALIRVHSSSELFDPTEELQFLSVSEFYGTVEKMAEAFLLDPNRREAGCELIADLYQPILARTIAIQGRFGSCEVYLPPELTLDLAAICGSSGYIHSCGYNIYVRAAYKATKQGFLEVLKRCVVSGKKGPPSKRVYFAVYAHEDFDKGDSELTQEIRHGLDDVKIHLEKFYMGQEREVEIVNGVRKNLGEYLEIAEPGESPWRREEVLRDEKANVDPDRTIWLIIDRATTENLGRAGEIGRIGQASRHPGETTYFIC